MGKKRKKPLPTVEQLEAELRRENRKNARRQILRNTLFSLVTVAAVSVLISVFLLPALRVTGDSMAPTLKDGDVVVAVKTASFERGELVAFYYGNKILIKRVAALAGDEVDMDEAGNVYVNGSLAGEPYEAAPPETEGDMEYPYTVPEGSMFVLGDHRGTALDSRSAMIGLVHREQALGRLFFRVWPLKDMGALG